MNFKHYFRESIWEYILCTSILCSFNVTIFSGFYIAPDLHYNYALLVGLAVSLNLLLFTGAYNKKSILISICVFVLFSVGFLIFVRQNQAMVNVFKDIETNPYMYFTITVLSSVGIFLLSRTKTGTGILFAAGSFVLAAIQFLYRADHRAALFIYICACGALFIYKNYKKNVLVSKTAKTAFGRTFTVAFIVCILTAAVSFGIFQGIDTIFDPPARELKLKTRYMALKTMERVGIADLTQIPDYDQKTSNTNEDKKESEGQKADGKSKGNLKDNKDAAEEKTNPNETDRSEQPFYKLVGYFKHDFRWLILLIPALLLLMSPVFIKLLLRKRWLTKLSEKDKETQIKAMYLFYLKRFKKMKIVKPKEDTLYQYIEKNHADLSHFNAEKGSVNFAELTETYMRTYYGGGDVQEEDLKGYLIFHKTFYENCRGFLGRFKYMLKFFIL